MIHSGWKKKKARISFKKYTLVQKALIESEVTVTGSGDYITQVALTRI